MALSDSVVWTIYLAPAILIVLFNAYWLWKIRAGRKHGRPVASCRPLGISLLVADLLRGTSGVCQALFALLTPSNSIPSVATRMCRVLGLTQQWSGITSCALTTIFFYEGLAYTLDPSVYFRRVRVTALVGMAGLHGFVTSFLPILGWGSYVYYPDLYACEIDNRRTSLDYHLFLIVCGSLLPWLSGVIIYFMILVTARRRSCHVSPARDFSQPEVTGGVDDDGSNRAIVNRVVERRLFVTEESFDYSGRKCALMFAVFFISWMYNAILRLLHVCGIVGRLATDGLWLYVVMATIGLLTSLVNPLTLLGIPFRRCQGCCSAGDYNPRRFWYMSSTPVVDQCSEAHGDCIHGRGCLASVAMFCAGDAKALRTKMSSEAELKENNGFERY